MFARRREILVDQIVLEQYALVDEFGKRANHPTSVDDKCRIKRGAHVTIMSGRVPFLHSHRDVCTHRYETTLCFVCRGLMRTEKR